MIVFMNIITIIVIMFIITADDIEDFLPITRRGKISRARTRKSERPLEDATDNSGEEPLDN